MNAITAVLTRSPLAARVVPFAVFIALTFLAPSFGDPGRFWVYLAKTIVGAWMLWRVRPAVAEMRARISWPGLAVGLLVAVLWVGTGDFLTRHGWVNRLPQLGQGAPWNPHVQFGQGSALTWLFLCVHLAGSTLVVPPLEEVFYRSFLYRYVAKVDFQTVPLGTFLWTPFLVTSALFAAEHQPRDWAAGLLCAFAYQGLVCWKKRLDDAIVAHALTNLLLGLWVIRQGAWQYW